MYIPLFISQVLSLDVSDAALAATDAIIPAAFLITEKQAMVPAKAQAGEKKLKIGSLGFA